MDIGKISERVMGMSDEAWQRHMNPCSGWSRITILPLLVLAIWSRIWLGWGSLVPVLLVLIWTWLNPRLFGPPQSIDNWMSQGIMGERIWLARKREPIPDHHARATLTLNIINAAGCILLVAGVWSFDIGLTLAGLITSMGAKLWFLDRMVWLKADLSPDQPPLKDLPDQD